MKDRRETIELTIEDDEKEEEKKEIDWWQLWEKYRLVAVFLFGILVLGVLAVLSFRPSKPVIEIIPAQEEEQATTVFVDLQGAVAKPGMYEMSAGARVNDVLVKAGGLAAEADRDWAAKNLNLAQPLTDGVKIYLPSTGETNSGSRGDVEGVAITTRVNLNTANLNELDDLWGIGEARAESIVAGRPYQKIEELLEKKIVPANVFERIKEELTVY